MFDTHMVRYTFEVVFKKSEQAYAQALGMLVADVTRMLNEMTDAHVRPQLVKLTLEYHANHQEWSRAMFKSYKPSQKQTDKPEKHCRHHGAILRASAIVAEMGSSPFCTGIVKRIHRSAAALIRDVEIVFCGCGGQRGRCVYFDDGECTPIRAGSRSTRPCDVLARMAKHLPTCLADAEKTDD